VWAVTVALWVLLLLPVLGLVGIPLLQRLRVRAR
jgi:hypothetical protein